MYCYHCGNVNGYVIVPWFVLAKVLGWHIPIIKVHIKIKYKFHSNRYCVYIEIPICENILLKIILPF